MTFETVCDDFFADERLTQKGAEEALKEVFMRELKKRVSDRKGREFIADLDYFDDSNTATNSATSQPHPDSMQGKRNRVMEELAKRSGG